MTTTNTATSSTSPSPDDTVPKIVRSASVKSCASDSGVSSSSPLSDNNIVHVNISYHFFNIPIFFFIKFCFSRFFVQII
jgi:hypothetical protein